MAEMRKVEETCAFPNKQKLDLPNSINETLEQKEDAEDDGSDSNKRQKLEISTENERNIVCSFSVEASEEVDIIEEDDDSDEDDSKEYDSEEYDSEEYDSDYDYSSYDSSDDSSDYSSYDSSDDSFFSDSSGDDTDSKTWLMTWTIYWIRSSLELRFKIQKGSNTIEPVRFRLHAPRLSHIYGVDLYPG